ncbi:MAG TPA: hypothetical protein VF518_07050, partial [Polyangia bacterium]
RLAAANPAVDRIDRDQAVLFRSLDQDVQAGKPLVATVFVNLTYYGRFVALQRNMYWGGRWGYSGYFANLPADCPVSQRQGRLRFKRTAPTLALPAGATAASVFVAPVRPAVYVVAIGYADGALAMKNAVQAVVEGATRFPVEVDGTRIDAIEDARIIGFAGHNPAFDGDLQHLLQISPTRRSPVATFAIGCCTGGTLPSCQPYRATPLFHRAAAVPLLFSDSLMTGEAFSFMALLIGLLDRQPLPRIVDRANDEYQRVLSRNGERHGRPFTPLPRLYASLANL